MEVNWSQMKCACGEKSRIVVNQTDKGGTDATINLARYSLHNLQFYRNKRTGAAVEAEAGDVGGGCGGSVLRLLSIYCIMVDSCFITQQHRRH